MSMCTIENLMAADIMTRDVVCLNEELDLHDCEKILLEKGISGAPVVDIKGRLLGVLSKTDLVIHHYQSGDDAEPSVPYRISDVRGSHVVDLNVPTARDVMTPVPCVVSEHTPVGELAALMVGRNVHRLVVCEDRRVTGIVSSMDILKAIAKEPASEGWDPGGFPG